MSCDICDLTLEAIFQRLGDLEGVVYFGGGVGDADDVDKVASHLCGKPPSADDEDVNVDGANHGTTQ